MSEMNLWELALANQRHRRKQDQPLPFKQPLIKLLDEDYRGDFDDLLDERCSSAYQLIGRPTPVYHDGREGLHRPGTIKSLAPQFWTAQWRMAMQVGEEMIQEQLKALDDTVSRYNALVTKFRGEVKNDVASVKAQAVATEDTVRRIGKAYAETTRMLTSPEFERALANAERMAAALKAVAELNSHSITFAVLDTKARGAA
jgi:hypothetical protein